MQNQEKPALEWGQSYRQLDRIANGETPGLARPAPKSESPSTTTAPRTPGYGGPATAPEQITPPKSRGERVKGAIKQSLQDFGAGSSRPGQSAGAAIGKAVGGMLAKRRAQRMKRATPPPDVKPREGPPPFVPQKRVPKMTSGVD